MRVGHFPMTLELQASGGSRTARRISRAKASAVVVVVLGKKKKNQEEAQQRFQTPLYGCCPSKATTTFDVLSVRSLSAILLPPRLRCEISLSST